MEGSRGGVSTSTLDQAPSPAQDDDCLKRFRKRFDAAWAPHEKRITDYKRYDDVYRGVLKTRDDNWRSMLHPPYAWQIVETYASNIIDGMPTCKIRPRHPGLEDAAKAHEQIEAAQRQLDHFAEKQPAWVTQGLVRGISPVKIIWNYETRAQTKWDYQPAYMAGPTREANTETITIRNQPSFIPWDAIDFMWDPSAQTANEWDCVFARTWSTLDALKDMQDAGVYRNVDDLKPGVKMADTSRDVKNRVEVWEMWERDRVVTVANGRTVLRDDPNPFWHGEIPFIAAVPFPEPFSVLGRSLCGTVEDLQRALWDLQNQRIDNARLINNHRTYYNRALVPDPTQIEDQFPGAIIAIDGPPGAAVYHDSPNANIIGPAVQAEQYIKKDLQDVTGAVSYVSGAQQDTIDQTTATGISIVSNMAQKRLLRVKQQYGYALMRTLYLKVKLNQQLLSAPQVFQAAGAAAAKEWQTITPQQLQGEFEFEVEDLEESLNRQERRSEALLKAQAFMQIAQYTPINFEQIARDISEAYGEDPTKYLGLPQPPQGMPAPQQSGPGAPPAAVPVPATPPPGGTGVAPPLNFANRANGVALPVLLDALENDMRFTMLRDELARERDRKIDLLVQAGQTYEEMLATAGEIRGMNLLLRRLTTKGQP
jgi:hypothetical protein